MNDILKELVEEFGKISFSFWCNNIGCIITFEGETSDERKYQVDIQSLSSDEKTVSLLFGIAFGNFENVKSFYYIMDQDNTLIQQ